MTQRTEGEAHALSLYLHYILSNGEEDGSNFTRIVDDLMAFLKTHHLQEHLEASVEPERRGNLRPSVGLISKTRFGGALIMALYSRCECFPCPAGQCEYEKGFCTLCGGKE